MIRKKVLFLLIGALLLAPSAIHVNADPQVGVFIPPNSMTDNTGYYGSIEGLFLKPNAEEPFAILAIQDDDDEFHGGGNPAEVAKAEYGRDGGFRAAIGRNVPNNPLEWGLEFTYIMSSERTRVEEPDGGQLGVISAYVEENIDSAVLAFATTDLDMFYVDLGAKYSVKFQDSFLFTVGAGIRFSNVEHDVKLEYYGDDDSAEDCGQGAFVGNADDDDGGCHTDRQQHYWGFGPRVTTTLGWDVGGGFNIFTGLNFTLLAGESETEFLQLEQADDVDDNVIHIRVIETRIVPVMDMRIGVHWVKQFTPTVRISLMLGYEFQNWFDLRDRFQSIDDDSQAALALETFDLGLEGPFFKLGAEF